MGSVSLAIITILSIVIDVTTAAAATRNVLITGYWPPSNEMVREFSPDPSHHSGTHGQNWKGRNWENRGFDIYSYFPEFPKPGDTVGEGDFEVDREKTTADLKKYTSLLHPIAIISFGLGAGDWEIEANFPDFWFHTGITEHSSLPLEKIREAVDADKSLPFHSWIDSSGDAGDYLCGYLGYLISRYHDEHSDSNDPAYNAAAGFIHVSGRYGVEAYTRATEDTLRAVITFIGGSETRGLP